MTNAAVDLADLPDPTIYPVEDDMGEGILQRLISEAFRPLLARFLATQARTAFVGADQFFYWEKYNATQCVSPDVYAVPCEPPPASLGAWKVWKEGVVPFFALEIVSTDIEKDYLRSPARYARLGVEELVVFDPDFEASPRRERLQVFRPQPDGTFEVQATRSDRVESKALGCWLVTVGEGLDTRIRVGTGSRGEVLFPTAEEQAESARREAESARREAESSHRNAEAERRARQELEAEIARLRAALKR